MSIIVPAYNAEKHISECLLSIAAQDFQDIEVLVVDDSSEDGTERLVLDFVAKDSRFKFVRHECNKGVMAARASGVCLSAGQFVGFVDADD